MNSANVAKKEMEAILEHEKAASDRVSAAREKALTLISAAQEEAERLLEQERVKAEKEASALILGSSAKSSALDEESKTAAKLEIERVKALASNRMAQATHAIEERVKGTFYGVA